MDAVLHLLDQVFLIAALVGMADDPPCCHLALGCIGDVEEVPNLRDQELLAFFNPQCLFECDDSVGLFALGWLKGKLSIVLILKGDVPIFSSW